jgi:hypothetical protein
MIRNTQTVVALVAVIVAVALVAVIPAAGADYYNNSSGVVQSDGPENATLDNILDAAVSLSPSLIGTGEQDPSNTGFQGFLLTGLVYGGVTLMAMAGVGIGAVGGSVLGILASYAFIDLGYAPVWIKPLLLIGVGAAAFLMFRRVVDR